jgi:hypothetical protein
MIRHIVLFRFDDPTQDFLDTVVERLFDLKNQIAEIQFIEAGINKNPNEKYHLALTVDVADLNALSKYANHPKHIEVAQLIRQKLAERACVDYEI